MTEQERKDILEYKKTLALYKQSCQEEYRSTHKNCITCELCDDRERLYPKCEVTGKCVGDFDWTRMIRAAMCKYYTPHIDETKQEEKYWIYERR